MNTEKANIRPKDPVMSKKSPKKGTLPVVVRGYKSAVTRYARKYHISFQWQSRYHDHIIRNQSECNRIANYIKNNVINWGKDKYN